VRRVKALPLLEVASVSSVVATLLRRAFLRERSGG
jgi:hypothetical protein